MNSSYTPDTNYPDSSFLVKAWTDEWDRGHYIVYHNGTGWVCAKFTWADKPDQSECEKMANDIANQLNQRSKR